MKYSLQLTLSFFLLSSLVACGGSGGGGDDAPPPPPDINVSGQLIAPEVPTATTGVVAQMQSVATSNITAQDEGCDSVPLGYRPLNGTTVEALFADKTVARSFNTNACGQFSLMLPPDVDSLSVREPGFEPLSADIKVFTDSDQGQLASLLPKGATYLISTLQYLGGDRLAFSIVDSISGRAVIGRPRSILSVTINSVEEPIRDISSVAATNNEASVVLVMDSSASMRYSVTPGFDRIDLASIAAHTFIEGKGAKDETAFIIFSSGVYLINEMNLEAGLPMQDSSGATVAWQFSDNGFVTASQPLHRVADAYNSNSIFYGGVSGRPLHVQSGDVLTSVSYPFYGSTGLWDAVLEGVSTLSTATNGRQLVVAMTDGADNTSVYDLDDVIARAKQENVPVHVIGFGTEREVNVDDLSRLAAETGGEFQRVEDEKLPDLYQNIQLGVRYQYVIEVLPLSTGDLVVLRIVTAGSGESQKQITIQ